MTKDAGDWFKYINSPHGHALKKYSFDILQERYSKHEKCLERLASQIATEDDLQDLGKLLVDVFEAGFMKAFIEYREKLKELGYTLQIKGEKIPQKTDPIFPQSEKSG